MSAQPRSRIGSAFAVWRPLRLPMFRNLLIANVFGDVGTFMQSVGAAWLMVSLNPGPMYVALTQTASALPFFLFALPAGAIGDICDRRKLILFTEVWMAGLAIVLAVVTVGGLITPWLLLALTFAMSAGDAFEAPTWRALLPELVDKEDLEAASALNGIEFNLARAVGPGLGGVLIATAGVGAAFIINAASFIGLIWVVARWKRPHRKRTTPPEKVIGATVAVIRYVRYSPGIRSPDPAIGRRHVLRQRVTGTLANGRSPPQRKCSYVRLAPRMLWFWRDTGGSCHATGAFAMVHGSCRLRWRDNPGCNDDRSGRSA